MREALIMAGITIGAVVTVFGPGDTPNKPAAAPTGNATAAVPTPSSLPPTVFSSGLATELRRAGDGHFYAGVSVSGRPVTMLVDTGASTVALTGDDARSAGLQWDAGQLGIVAQGASGPIRGVSITLDRLTLGGHEVRNVDAVIIPEGLPVSLLGQSFLSTIEPVRIEKERMILGGA